MDMLASMAWVFSEAAAAGPGTKQNALLLREESVPPMPTNIVTAVAEGTPPGHTSSTAAAVGVVHLLFCSK